MKGKAPIQTDAKSIYFNTTNGLRIELGSTPQMITYQNQKLTAAQATNDKTADRTQYLHRMGEQLGLATKLYQLKGKEAEMEKESDWEITVAIVVSVGVLFFIIAGCIINDRNKKNNARQNATDIEEDVNQQASVALNESDKE